MDTCSKKLFTRQWYWWNNDRKQAVELLLNTIEAVCKKQGKQYMFSIGRSKHLINTHKKLGWVVDDKPSHEIVKII